MNKKQYFFLIICLFLFLNAIAQTEDDSVSIGIDLRWKSEKLELNKNYSSTNDTLQLKTLKFYLSDLEIVYQNGLFFKEKNRYHLIDIESKESLHFSIPKSNNPISKVIFSIGIDSTASVSGALSGDLDPSKGMYWAWQSGYINMKIEGISKSCKTRKNKFQFHIGGYLEPFYAIRNFNCNYNINQMGRITIKVDLAQLFDDVKLSETNTIMIPGNEAIKIADLTSKMFSVE